ncbi:MAG: OmpH family outer membrane protein [Desulfovibrionaceae bacterium]|nr:OmpH family outer membrane protein [Desulfovibrionaceae bacterium]
MIRMCSLVLAAVLMFAGTSFSADVKIGIFNSESVVMDSDAAKAARKKMESDFGAEKRQLESQGKDLQKRAEQLSAQASSLSEKAREEKANDFMKARRAYEEKARNFARRVENTNAQIRQSMAQQIYQAAANVAKQKGLDLVLDAVAGGVIFTVPQMDIQKDMLAEVNRIWKANGSRFSTSSTGGDSKSKRK